MRIFISILFLLLPSCLTPKLWEPDTHGYSPEPVALFLIPQRAVVGFDEEGQIRSTYIEFESPEGVVPPKALRKLLTNRRGTFLIRPQRIQDFQIPIHCLGHDKPVSFQQALQSEDFLFKLVITNQDAKARVDSALIPGRWDARLVIANREKTPLQILDCWAEYRTQFAPEKSMEIVKLQERLKLEYEEYKVWPRYDRSGLVTRILVTPFAVVGDVIIGLGLVITLGLLNDLEDSCDGDS